MPILIYFNAQRATEDQLQEMQTILDDMRSCTNNINAYLEKAIEFHSALARATQNPIFFAIWNASADLIFRYYQDLLKDLDIKILKKLYRVNAAVFEAILSKDTEKIQQAMTQHIDAEHEILWPE